MAETRLYSLFEIETLPNGRKRYHRISKYAFKHSTAVRLFQGQLLEPVLYGFKDDGTVMRPRCLRVVDGELKELPKL